MMRRLLRTARPDWGVFPIALLAVLLAACSAPFQAGRRVWRSLTAKLKAYFFNLALMSYYAHSLNEMLPQLDRACLGLILVGVVFGICVFVQNSLFVYIQEPVWELDGGSYASSQEGISLRLRKNAFGSTLRMDIGFFDKPEPP